MDMKPLLAMALGTAIATGCSSAPPQLTYVGYQDNSTTPQADYGGLTKFTLAKSILLVKPAPSGSATGATLASVPAEAHGPDTDFGFKQAGGWSSASPLQVSKLDNTNLIRSIGLQASITQVAPSAAKASGPTEVLASPALDAKPNGAKPAMLPLAIDMQKLLATPRREAGVLWGVVENAERKVAFEVSFEGVPVDAIETRQLDLAKAAPLYFYSACRNVTLTFLSTPLERQQFSVTVADPNFVQTIALNRNGTIASHSTCGVDLTTASADEAATLDALNQRIAQARSVSTAWVTRPALDKSAAVAEAKASLPVVKPAPKVVIISPAEKRKRNEALHNAEIEMRKTPPPRETFAF